MNNVSKFLLGFFYISCKYQPHGIFRHAADNSGSVLLQNIIPFKDQISQPYRVYVFGEVMFIEGKDPFLYDSPHIIDGLFFPVCAYNGHDGISIIGPAGITFGKIVGRFLASFLLQPFLQLAGDHDIDVGYTAYRGKVNAALLRRFSQQGLKEDRRLILIFSLQAG